jgi:hypothetical protein
MTTTTQGRAPNMQLVRDEPREAPVSIDTRPGTDIDAQIATARRYPRSIRGFIDKATQMACLDEETAKACFYALPRDGKTVTGPSARLAEICVAAYGNLRAQARIVDEDDRFITARGESWDIEANAAIAFEVRRRITNRNGAKYSDDMIVVTGNAASSIALRNAVFKVIPSAFWRPIYEKARVVAVGNAQTLSTRRAKMLEHFQKLGVEGPRVLALLGVKGIEDVTLEHMETLIGIATAIKEGDTTIDEAFADVPATPQRKSEQPPATAEQPKQSEAAATSTAAGREGDSLNGSGGSTVGAAAEEAVASAPSSPLPAGCDRIVSVERAFPDKPTFAMAATERGLQVYAYDSRANLTELKGRVVRFILGNNRFRGAVEVMKAEVVS